METEPRQYAIDVPPLVHQAKQLAEALGFDLRPEGNSPGSVPAGPSCCIDEVGSLLMTLASAVTSGVIAEIGTGAGVGTAWLASNLSPDARLVTVETEPQLAGAVNELFSSMKQVEVIQGDWQEDFVQHAPFDLLFADGGGIGSADESLWPVVADLVSPGGMVVIDDLTPEEYWPDSWRGNPDPKREFAFHSGFFTATEIRTRVDVSTLLMVKK